MGRKIIRDLKTDGFRSRQVRWSIILELGDWDINSGRGVRAEVVYALQNVSQSSRNKYLIFGALAIGLFASVVDHGSVIVALPSVAEDLKIELPSVQWVVIGFALTISALLLPMGRLADMIGQKRVYILGSILLMVGAAGAGFAPNLAPLLLARILQGVGAAMTQGTGMAIMTSVFPSAERGRAIGLLMTTVGVGAVVGPAIGGTIVDLIHWRAVFFLNIPLGLLGIVATLIVLRHWESEKALRGSGFDWAGAILSTGVLVALLLGLTLAVGRGWMSAPILAAFVLSASMFVAFIWWELRAPSPMFDLRFFRDRVFSFGVAAGFLTFLGQSAVLFLMPFYVQNILDYSPKIAGLVVMPGALCMAIMGSVSGTLSDKFGWRWFTVGGMMLSVLGLIILSRITETSHLWEVIPGLVLVNSGMGMFYSPNSSSILSAVGRESYGVVSGFLNLVRNSANVISLAIATTIVTLTMGSLGFEPSLEAVRNDAVVGVRGAFTVGMRYAFYVLICLVIASMAVSFLQGSARTAPQTEQPAPQPGD